VYTDKCYQECHILNRIMDMVQYITVVCITIFAVLMFILLGGSIKAAPKLAKKHL
jgi:hypothetical protein